MVFASSQISWAVFHLLCPCIPAAFRTCLVFHNVKVYFESTTIPQNVGDYLPVNTAKHPRRLESSGTLL
jgi:hypothetical protein